MVVCIVVLSVLVRLGFWPPISRILMLFAWFHAGFFLVKPCRARLGRQRAGPVSFFATL